MATLFSLLPVWGFSSTLTLISFPYETIHVIPESDIGIIRVSGGRGAKTQKWIYPF